MIINFYGDPAHGWGKVKRSLLTKLGIAGKISSYSYQRGDHVYLEEDSDLPKLVQALEDKGVTFSFKEHHTDKSSKIRRYDRYSEPVGPAISSRRFGNETYIHEV